MKENILESLDGVSLKSKLDDWHNRILLPHIPNWFKPNHITKIRLYLVPLVVTLSLFGYFVLATTIFILAALTDYYDGWLARERSTFSKWGKIWDERADKILIAAVVLAKIISTFKVGGLTVEVGILGSLLSITMARDFVMVWARNNNLTKTKVLWSAKLKTTIQMFAIVFLLLSGYSQVVLYLGLGLFFLSTAFSVYSGWVYLKPLRIRHSQADH